LLDLLEQAVKIGHDPALHQLTSLNPVDGDALERDSPAGRRDSAESALVCAELADSADDHLISVTQQHVSLPESGVVE